jgi:hypothetical protein
VAADAVVSLSGCLNTMLVGAAVKTVLRSTRVREKSFRR